MRPLLVVSIFLALALSVAGCASTRTIVIETERPAQVLQQGGSVVCEQSPCRWTFSRTACNGLFQSFNPFIGFSALERGTDGIVYQGAMLRFCELDEGQVVRIDMSGDVAVTSTPVEFIDTALERSVALTQTILRARIRSMRLLRQEDSAQGNLEVELEVQQPPLKGSLADQLIRRRVYVRHPARLRQDPPPLRRSRISLGAEVVVFDQGPLGTGSGAEAAPHVENAADRGAAIQEALSAARLGETPHSLGATSVVRAVPQTGWDRGGPDSFVGMVPGDRYALVQAEGVTLVVDLHSQRLAHRLLGSVRRVGPREHQVTLQMSGSQLGGVLDLVSGRWACQSERGDDVLDGLLSADGKTCALVSRSKSRSELVLSALQPGSGASNARRVTLPEPPGGALSVELANEREGAADWLLRGTRGCPVCRKPTPREVFQLSVSKVDGRTTAGEAWLRVDPSTLGPTHGALPLGRPRPLTPAEAARVARTQGRLAHPTGLSGVVSSGDLRAAVTISQDARAGSGSGARLAAWSVVDAARTAVLLPSGDASFDRAAGFLDAQTVLVTGEASTKDSRSTTASIGVWHLDTGKVDHRTFQPVSSTSPILPSPTGRRFIVQRPSRDRSRSFEVWTLGATRPDWADGSAVGAIGWSDDGERVLHRKGQGPVEARAAASGQAVAAAPADQRVITAFVGLRADPGPLASGYRLRVSGAAASLETQDGDTIVSLLDFADGEWLALAPDGAYSGSASATRHVAWFRADGSVAPEADVAALRRPDVVKRRLAQLFEARPPAPR